MDHNTRYSVKITLVFLSYDLAQGNLYTVSIDKDSLVFPSVSLDNTTSVETIIRQLKEKYIDLDPQWIKHKITEVFLHSKENEIILIYYAKIPITTKMKDCYWLRAYDFLSHPILVEALKYEMA